MYSFPIHCGYPFRVFMHLFRAVPILRVFCVHDDLDLFDMRNDDLLI
jgi:hypothetical protein